MEKGGSCRQPGLRLGEPSFGAPVLGSEHGGVKIREHLILRASGEVEVRLVPVRGEQLDDVRVG